MLINYILIPRLYIRVLLATLSLVVPGSLTSSVPIYWGSGFGTLYYDVKNVSSCSGDNFTEQNTGLVSCSPVIGQSLNALNTNYLVAMNNTELEANLHLYCGKQVIVYINGQPSSLPLFVGDGCGRCSKGSLTASKFEWDPVMVL